MGECRGAVDLGVDVQLGFGFDIASRRTAWETGGSSGGLLAGDLREDVVRGGVRRDRLCGCSATDSFSERS